MNKKKEPEILCTSTYNITNNNHKKRLLLYYSCNPCVPNVSCVPDDKYCFPDQDNDCKPDVWEPHPCIPDEGCDPDYKCGPGI